MARCVLDSDTVSYRRPDPSGRVTPGGLLAILGIAGMMWYTFQPQEQRAGLLCRSSCCCSG